MPSSPDPPSRRWLLATGVLLTAGTLALVALLVFTDPPTWLWSMLAVSPWGPIVLVVWVLLHRRDRLARRLAEVGIHATAAITAIGQTASAVGGRPVVVLDLTVEAEGRPGWEVSLRTAPPAHLIGALRPGVVMPVLVDPDEPTRLLPDWRTAERWI
jgi:hypothetical protein